MSDQTVAIIVAVLGSSAFLKIIDFIIAKLKKPSNLEEGAKWLLQDKLEFLATREIQSGATTVKMKSFIREGCKIYEELEGDGEMKTLMESYEALPIKY